MPRSLHLFQLFNPLLDRKLFLVIMIFGEKITVLTTKVASVRDINRADGIFRQAKDKQARNLCAAAKCFGQTHNQIQLDQIMLGSLSIKNSHKNASEYQVHQPRPLERPAHAIA